MRQLVKITFINSADYDYFELKVDGDTAVYGINDGGKTTCARAVMYGEHGSINALNFGQAESIDYYFHKGNNDGMLVYDYEEVREDGIVVPYCLIMTSREINFVTARFSKDWILTSSGMMTTEWSKLREKISKSEGDIKIFNVSSKRNLEFILQGSYADKNDEMRRLARHFSIFEGKNGKTCAAAKMIESLWKNGSMQQDDMKRIIIDRTEANNRERYEREPAFKIDSARELADGFEEGWRDFEKYLSQELPKLMDTISDSFSGYNDCQKRLASYPSLINSVLHIKKEACDSLIGDLSKLKEQIKEKSAEIEALKDSNATASKQRSEKIGGLKERIHSVTDAYSRYSSADWEAISTDINDWEHIQGISEKIAALNKEIQAMESSAEAFTKELKQSQLSLRNKHAESQNSFKQQRIEIEAEQLADESLKMLERKKEHSAEEAAANLSEKRIYLEKKEADLKDEEKRLSLLKHVVDKFSENDFIAEQFAKSNDLSFLGNLGKNVIGRFFKLVFAFICREVFGIKSLTREDYLNEVETLEKTNKQFIEEKNRFLSELQQEAEKLSKGYAEKISIIRDGYQNRLVDLQRQEDAEQSSFEMGLELIKKQIEAVLEAHDIDINLLEGKRAEAKSITERYNYLFSNKDVISNQKRIREEFQNLGSIRNVLSSQERDDAKETKKENEALAAQESIYAALISNRTEQDKAIRRLNSELQSRDENVETLSRETGFKFESLNEQIDSAEVSRIPEENLKTLSEYFSDWKLLYEKRNNHLQSMRSNCQLLQRMLSPKDFFEFSIKPSDSQKSDEDILRICRIVSRRNDANSEESINQFLNNWRQSWNQYLRIIYKIAERASELSSIEDTVRHIQTFINTHNDAHSISNIRFEVEKGSENKLVEIALDIKNYLDINGIDVNQVDVSEGVDTNLFMLENVSESIRRRLIDRMSEFAKEIKDYKYPAIPPEDFFTLYTFIKEENKPELRFKNVNQIGSTGTGLTVKAVLTIGFVGEALRADSPGNKDRNAIHVFVDEFGRIDPWNKKTIVNMCAKFNVRLFSAEPYASNEKGDVKYGYSLNYDKRTHHRSGKLIKELKLIPKTDA